MTPQSKLVTDNITDKQLQVQNCIYKAHHLVKVSGQLHDRQHHLNGKVPATRWTEST